MTVFQDSFYLINIEILLEDATNFTSSGRCQTEWWDYFASGAFFNSAVTVSERYEFVKARWSSTVNDYQRVWFIK